jgi:hypothetical protein
MGGGVWMCALGEPIESRVVACAGIRDTGERLACYDILAASLSASATSAAGADSGAAGVGAPASATSAPQSATHATALAASSAMFGLKGHASSRGVMTRDSLNSIKARVTQLWERSTGGVQVELDNGQTWEQLGSRDLQLKAGDPVRITRAALGSFWLTTPSRVGTRVRRLR